MINKLLLVFVLFFFQSTKVHATYEGFCDVIVQYLMQGTSPEMFKSEYIDTVITDKAAAEKVEQVYLKLGLIKSKHGSELSHQCHQAMIVDSPLAARNKKMGHPSFMMDKTLDILFTSQKGGIDAMVEMSSEATRVECEERKRALDMSCFNFSSFGFSASLEALLDVHEYSKNPEISRFSDEDCHCLQKEVDSSPDKQRIIQEASAQKEKLTELIRDNASKKFLNDYAATLEDVNFYLNTNAGVFEKRRWKRKLLGTKASYNEEIQCNDAEEFEKKIKNRCKDEGVSEAKINERISRTMSSFGMVGSGKSFAENLKTLEEDVTTLTLDEKILGKGKPNKFDRDEYDAVRYGLIKKKPHVKFIDDLVSGILKDPLLRGRLRDQIGEDKPPHLALLSVLGNGFNAEAINQVLRRSREKFPGIITDANDKKFGESMEKTLHFALSLHPGLKNFLTDFKLFNEVSGKMLEKENSFKSVLDVVEGEKKLLNDHFIKRCENLQVQLAEVVCTKDEELIPKIGRKNIASMLYHENDGVNPKSKDIAICSIETAINPNLGFQGVPLEKNDPYTYSDYLDRKLNPISKQRNGFSKTMYKIAIEKDAEFTNYVAKVAQDYSHERTTAFTKMYSNNQLSLTKGHGGRAPDVLDAELADLTLPSDNLSSVKNAPAQFQASGAPVDFSSSQIGSAQQIARVSDAMNPVNRSTPQIIPSTDGPTESVAKETLKDVLSSYGDKKKIEKYMSNIQDEDAQELLRIREEVLRNQNKIAEMNSEYERARTRELEEKYNSLQKKYDNAVKGQGHESDQESYHNEHYGASSGGFATGKSFGGDHRIHPVENYQEPGFNDGTSLAPAPTQGRNLASLTALGGDKVIEARIKEALILSSTSDNGQGASTGQNDPSQELITYLNQTEPDILTLQGLKREGIIYKYKVMEDGVFKEKIVKIDYLSLTPEAKKLIEKKIAEKNQGDMIAVAELERQMILAKREHSIQALKLLLSEKLSR